MKTSACVPACDRGCPTVPLPPRALTWTNRLRRKLPLLLAQSRPLLRSPLTLSCCLRGVPGPRVQKGVIHHCAVACGGGMVCTGQGSCFRVCTSARPMHDGADGHTAQHLHSLMRPCVRSGIAFLSLCRSSPIPLSNPPRLHPEREHLMTCVCDAHIKGSSLSIIGSFPHN